MKCFYCKKQKARTSFYSAPPNKSRKKQGLDSYCKACNALHQAHTNIMLRGAMLAYYSKDTISCECCGESEWEFLSLDHINGGGRKHKEKLKATGLHFYRVLIKQGFPKGLRVLCHNCNQALGYFGFCPHEIKRQAKTPVEEGPMQGESSSSLASQCLPQGF